MKIRSITATEVIVPANPGAINSSGLSRPLHRLPVAGRVGWSVQFDELPKCILRMQLEDGTVGLGECYRGHDWATIEAVSTVLLNRRFEEIALQSLPIGACREYDGFECAIWDCFARVHGLRVVDLLGGALRTEVKIGAWSGHRESREVGSLCEEFARKGYDCVKFKCDLQDDVVGWCREIADRAPGLKVILDPNERWKTPAETRERIDALREIGNILCLEDPIPRWMLDEYRRLRQFSPIPIVLHVSLPYLQEGQRVSDAVLALKQSAVDGFNFNAGLAKFQCLDHVAVAAGLPCWHGSEVDLGILEAMYLHSCAAAQSCVWPSDIFGRLIRSHDLLKKPLEISPPYASLPEGPGLGVELDEESLKRYQIQERWFKLGQ